jgi:hypothetical protein
MQLITSNRVRGACAWALLGLGLLTLCSTVVGVVLNFSPVPYWDQWDGTVDFYMRALVDPLSAFFAQHNEHRLVLPQLIFFADMRYFGGRNVFSLAANLVLALLLAGALYRIATRHLPHIRADRMIAAGIALTLVFSWAQRENFTWGFQSQWFAVYLFALCAFYSLERAADGTPRPSPWWCALAMVCAAMAVMSMASGLLVLPVLVVMAMYLRLPMSNVVSLLVMCAVTWAAYFHHWTSPNGTSVTAAITQHPLGVLQYVVLYLGAPLYYSFPRWPFTAWVCGVATLAGVAIGVWKTLLGDKQPQSLTLLATALFLVGNAIVTASGRYSFGLDSALVSRYTTASSLALATTVLFLWINSSKPTTRKGVEVVIALLVALIFIGQPLALRKAHDEVYRKKIGGLALRLQLYDPTYTSGLFPIEGLRPIAQQAQAAGLSIFAPDNVDYPPLPDRVTASTQCDGQIDQVMPTQTAGVFAARGWAVDPGTHKYVQSVLLAGTDGQVLGEALTGERRNDLREHTGIHDGYGGWLGFFKSPPDKQLQAFGVLSTGGYCVLRGTRTVPVGTALDSKPG